MAVIVRCPNPDCGKKLLRAPEEDLGRPVRCIHCEYQFIFSSKDLLNISPSPGERPPPDALPAGKPFSILVRTWKGFWGRLQGFLYRLLRRTRPSAPPNPSPLDTVRCPVEIPAEANPAGSAAAASAPGSSAIAASPDSAGPWPLPPDWPQQIGRFQIRGRLGGGAFGTVYKAYDPQLEREVALKVPRPGTLDSPKRVERFLGDARAAAQLRHPHIVPVYDAGQDGASYYIASAYIQGRTLADAADEGFLAFSRVAEIVHALAEALAYAHETGIVHRDVKPANIMLDTKGQPHLIDFGLAHRQDTVEKRTHEGAVLGTPAYMAPEQAAGQKGNPMPASDQYSLGVVLYDLLCGQTPFSGPPQIVLFHTLHHEPPAPRRLRREIPRDLETICLKAMAKRPAERYAGCKALADDLRRWLDGEPIKARRLGPAERLVRWCRRQPALAGAVAVAVLALVAIAVLSVGFGLWRWEAARALAEENRRTKEAAAEAREQRLRADREKLQAEEHSRQVDREAARLILARAQAAGEEGEIGLAMLQLARGLELADHSGDARLQEVIRRNLAAWRRRLHPLTGCFRLPTRILALAVRADGKQVLLGCEDGTARLWDLAKGEAVGAPLPHREAVRAVAFAPDGRHILTGSADHLVRLWDCQTRGKPHLLRGHAGTVLAVVFSADGQRGASASADHTVIVWDLKRKEALRALKGHTGPVHGVDFSPKGDLILTGSADGTARLWQTDGGKEIHQYAGQGEVRAVAFSPDGATVLLGRGSLIRGEAELWQVKGGRLARLPHQSEVLGVAYSPDGTLLLTGGKDRAARLWQAATGVPLGRPLWHPQDVQAVDFGPTRTVLTAGGDQTVRVWGVAVDGPRAEWRRGQTTALALSPDGKSSLLATHFKEGQTRFLDGATAEPVGVPVKLSSPVSALALSPDGSRFLTGSEDGTVLLWDVKTGQSSAPFPGHADSERIFRLAFSPDGKSFISASFDGSAFIWDINDVMRRKPRLLRHTGQARVFAVAFSPDGKKVLTGGADRHCRLWDVVSGRELRSFAHPDAVLAVAFHPSGRSILTGYVGGAQLWNADTGERIGPPFPHRTGVLTVAFSPDGKTVLTGGTDGSARLWDAATQKPIGPRLIHGAPVFAAAFHPRGRTFATATWQSEELEAVVRTWETPAAIRGSVKRVGLWTRAVTGMELTGQEVVQVLSSRAWEEVRERLKDLGGAPDRP
jgi:WD40 repeat protein/tRNA A-37 threonylcarbamoyl transferase component Bud32